MKTIEIQLYKFNELSEEAKNTAISNFDASDDVYFAYDEIKDSVTAMADLLGLKFGREYTDLRYGHLEDSILNLSGARLYTYLVNNYYSSLFKPKYIKTIDRHVSWKQFICKQAKGHVTPEYTQIYSKNFKDSDCVLTGACFDNDVLQPVYEFLKKPTNSTFEDLIKDIENAIYKLYRDTGDYYNSREYIVETLESNDCCDFTSNGKMH